MDQKEYDDFMEEINTLLIQYIQTEIGSIDSSLRVTQIRDARSKALMEHFRTQID